MRILLVHNHYGSTAPSGENEAVRLEHDLLRSHGHEVRLHTRNSDEIRGRGAIGTLQGALAVAWNPFEAHRVARAVAEFQPDVVHAHNTFPLISPAVFHAARAAPARVLTLHNYRLWCAAAIPMRNGETCTDCIDARSARPALRHGCYRDSRAATVPLATGIALHRALGTWQREVEAFVALTDFQRALMIRGGLPASRVEVKPNFFPGRPQPLDWDRRPLSCVFAGRLSAEKGITKLIDVWRLWGQEAPELRVVGDGPLRAALEAAAAGSRVRFLGLLSPTEAQDEIGKSRLLILPSECLEGFPLSLREAFALGTPAAVSRLGALPALVDEGRCGVLIDPYDRQTVLGTLQAAWHDQAKLARLGQLGRNEFLNRYTADANHQSLMHIYERARARRGQTH